MAGKSADKIVMAMAEAVRAGSDDQLRTLRRDILFEAVLESPATAVVDVEGVVDSNLGYLAGYLPIEYGQQVLDCLQIAHPVFGSRLDKSMDEVLAAGVLIAEQYREKQLAEERKARLAAKRAEGLDLPDVDTAVTSEDAKRLLAAIKAKRDGGALDPVTDDTSAYGAVDPQPRQASDTAYKTLMGMLSKSESEPKAEAEVEEDDDEDYF